MNTISDLLLSKLGGKFHEAVSIDLSTVEKVDPVKVSGILHDFSYELCYQYQEKAEEIGDDWITKKGKFTKRLQRALPDILTLKLPREKDCTEEVRKGFADLFAKARQEGRTEVTPVEVATFLVDLGYWKPARDDNRESYIKNPCATVLTRNIFSSFFLLEHAPHSHSIEEDSKSLFESFCNNFSYHGKLQRNTDTLVSGEIGERITREAYLGGKKTWCVSLTDTIYWDDDNFGKNDSCWWGCYKESKDVFTENGGLGLLWHTDANDIGNGTARVWLAPLHTARGDALFLFNQYGKANDKPIRMEDTARFIVDLLGKDDYRWLNGTLKNTVSSDVPYINDYGSGIFICHADSGYAPNYRFEVSWGDDLHFETCSRCDSRLDADYGEVYYEPDGDCVCYDCWCENCFVCDKCNETGYNDDAHEYHGSYYCESCFDYYYAECAYCGDVHPKDKDEIWEIDGDYCCSDCYTDRYTICDGCSEDILLVLAHEYEMGYYCQDCFESKQDEQEECNTNEVILVTG